MIYTECVVPEMVEKNWTKYAEDLKNIHTPIDPQRVVLIVTLPFQAIKCVNFFGLRTPPESI